MCACVCVCLPAGVYVYMYTNVCLSLCLCGKMFCLFLHHNIADKHAVVYSSYTPELTFSA